MCERVRYDGPLHSRLTNPGLTASGKCVGEQTLPMVPANDFDLASSDQAFT